MHNIVIGNIKNVPHLEVITGGMFSGKSIEISRRLTSIYYYNQSNSNNQVRSLVIRPLTDNRSEETRNIPYKQFEQMLIEANITPRMENHLESKLLNYDMIIFDEAQFFEGGISQLIEFLLDHDKYVLVCGLDKDYKMEPFSEFMKWVLASADEVTKLHAVCSKCGRPSDGAKLISTSDCDQIDSNIFIEDDNHKYIPLCRKCMKSYVP